MEEQESMDTKKVSEWIGKLPQVLQTGSTKGILETKPKNWMSLHGGESSLSLEQWEAQWKEFLRRVESPHSPWGIPTMPGKPFPWEDAKAFLATFEQVAEACQWPQEEWATRLLPALSGEAEKAFKGLGIRDREDYGKVKTILLKEDALNREKQHQQFRGFCYQESEGPRMAYSRLRKMCCGWLRVENHSKEEILELLVLEQWLNILPCEIQTWVRERSPESCSQAVALAEEFLFRQERQVPSEEVPGSFSKSKWSHPSVVVKEEDDREAGLMGKSSAWKRITYSGPPAPVWSDHSEKEMEKETPAVPKLGEVSERRGIAPHLLQTGSIGEILQRRTGHLMNQPTSEGSLSLEQWEVQWQEFLKTLKSSHSPCGIPPLLAKPSPWEDAKAFLVSFEQVAEACQWPQEEWVIRLLPALSGDAKRAFDKLDVPDREDYGKVKAAILRGDALSQEKQREEFRHFCYQEAEGPWGAYRRLREMCRGWLRVENHSKEQILERLILEQLLSVLPPEIQSRVRESGPESCSQAAALAEEFLLRLEKEVPLEEAAGSVLKMGQIISESEQRHPSVDIKEEEDGEARMLGDNQQNKVDEELRRLSSVKANNPGHFKNLDRAKGQEGSHEVEKGDQPYLCQGRDFGEVTDVGEETRKYSECNMEASDKAQYNNNENCGIKTFQCLECGKSFSCTSKFLRHQGIHSVGKLYLCSFCGKSFSHKPNFILHQRIHTEQKQFICSESDKNFSDMNKSNIHFSKHTNMKASKCFQCGKYFRYKSQFLTHLRTHTGEKPFECSECGKNFIRSFHLQRHLRTHTGEKPFECPECKKKFNQSYNFQQHLRTHTGEKPFECLECGKKFNKSSNFQQHQRIHTGEKPFECSECGKKFNQSYHLQRHLRTHTGARPFQCSDCGNNSNWIASVHQPQRTHRGEKPFECPKCGKCFNWSADLQWHQGIYTRRKPYECSDCGKKFSRSFNLQRHQKTHTGEKPFECSGCGKKFSQSYHLQRHLRTHTAEKPFQCSECGKEFIQSCHLEQHQRTHTGEKPFE